MSDDDRLAALAARAAERRHDGTYPPGIDDALRSEVDQRLQAAASHTTALRAAVADLRSLGAVELPAYRGSNRVKRIYASLANRVFGYAFGDLVHQLERRRVALDRVLDAVVAEAERPRTDGL